MATVFTREPSGGTPRDSALLPRTPRRSRSWAAAAKAASAGRCRRSMCSASRVSGVGRDEPNELVLTAGAGMPLADIEALLAENGQMLAFEPPDHAHLFAVSATAPIAGAARAGTLGGVLAANSSGPRRFLAAPPATIFWASAPSMAAARRSRPVAASLKTSRVSICRSCWPVPGERWPRSGSHFEVMPVPEFSARC